MRAIVERFLVSLRIRAKASPIQKNISSLFHGHLLVINTLVLIGH